MILLDTHVLIWMDTDSNLLGRHTRRLISESWEISEIGVSAISFWESAMFHRKGRLGLRLAPDQWRAELLSTGLVEVPLDGAAGVLAADMDGLHKDPTDRFIAATAIAKNAALVTADDALLHWRHRLVRQDARK